VELIFRLVKRSTDNPTQTVHYKNIEEVVAIHSSMCGHKMLTTSENRNTIVHSSMCGHKMLTTSENRNTVVQITVYVSPKSRLFNKKSPKNKTILSTFSFIKIDGTCTR